MRAKVEFIPGPLDLAVAQRYLSETSHLRASTLVWGNVALVNQGRSVKGINYDIHLTLAQMTAETLIVETQLAFPSVTALYFAHSYHFVESGNVCTILGIAADNWLVVGAASSFFIQQMKQRLPIWKLEHYQDGQQQWLAGAYTLKGTLSC